MSRLPVVSDSSIPAPDALVGNGWRPLLWRHTEHGERTFTIAESPGDASRQCRMLHADGWQAVKWVHPTLGGAEVVDGLWRSVEEWKLDFDALEIAWKKYRCAQKSRFRARKSRSWDLLLGPVSGKAGTTQVVSVSSGARFDIEKLVAVDAEYVEIEPYDWRAWAASPARSPILETSGSRTEIMDLVVDGIAQPFPAGLTKAFSTAVDLPGVRSSIVSIALTVKFLSDAVWEGLLYGVVTY